MAARSRKTAGKGSGTIAAGKLAGKTVAFVGKFGYRDMFLDHYRKWIAAEGGTVVDLDTTVPDYLVAGEGRGGNPPAAVAKVQKQHPSVQVLSETELAEMVMPTPEEFLAEVRAGQKDHTRWEHLQLIARKAGKTIDLAGADLRKVDLFGAHLDVANLDGADLRNVSAHYTHFPDLRNVKFDGADLPNAYFANAEDCSFRKANLTHCWLAFGDANHYEGCDFTGAKLPKGRGENAVFLRCTFAGADLSDAEIENSDFSGADLSRADLSRAHASKSKFVGANLGRAILYRTDLRNASLANADLRGADLREAVLNGADLTGANIEGANFAGAVLDGAKTAGLDPSRAKNFNPPVTRQPGPKMRELAKAALTGKQFSTSAEVDLGKGEHATLALYSDNTGTRPYLHARSAYRRDDNSATDLIDAPTFEQGLFNLAARWPGATLRLDTITASGCRTPRGKQLLELATAAWAEAFGLEEISAEKLQQQKADQQAAVQKLREDMLAELRGGAAGVKKWNARTEHEREQIGTLHDLDLKGAKLSGISIERMDLEGSNFEGAALKKAKLWDCRLPKTNFARADLQEVNLDFSNCEGASFEGARLVRCSASMAHFNGANLRGADLTGADLSSAHLLGADLTDARLDRVDFERASHDAQTRFPAGFTPPDTMSFVGPPPGAVPAGPAAPGTLDFATFFQQLDWKVDAGRLEKAVAMLKADRFQLFSEVKDDALLGVVRSQSIGDLVYSCRLASDGTFGCCTQNLRPCGGLQGALCKHLLVLIVGLTRSGRLDPATVDGWIEASKKQKPQLDRDAMGETFLRYKGAQAGEVDWRPTETIPEDYYAL
jgi:uncharacterized protein YjbI with pentapeptide repeats